MHSEENTHILHITIKKYYNIFKTHIYLRISRKCGRYETIQTDATNIFESLGFRGKKSVHSLVKQIKSKENTMQSLDYMRETCSDSFYKSKERRELEIK